jgi:hypothetical protein
MLFVGVMLVVLAATLRTAYEGAGWRWAARRRFSGQLIKDEEIFDYGAFGKVSGTGG